MNGNPFQLIESYLESEQVRKAEAIFGRRRFFLTLSKGYETRLRLHRLASTGSLPPSRDELEGKHFATIKGITYETRVWQPEPYRLWVRFDGHDDILVDGIHLDGGCIE